MSGLGWLPIAVTAAAAIWWRWKGGVQLGTGALAIYAALAVTGLQQMNENPAAARGAVLSLTPLLILWWRREEFPDP